MGVSITARGVIRLGVEDDEEVEERLEGENGNDKEARTSKAILQSFACVWSSTCVATVCTAGLPAKRHRGGR